MTKVINYGSMNIDYVYEVPHIAVPGETISSSKYTIHCGGKGANQSIALAKANIEVKHAGQIGEDGLFIKEKLNQAGVDTDFVFVGKYPTGHAVIQVAKDGENSIVLFPGANHKVTEKQLDAVLDSAEPGDILLLQNEININETAINKAFELGMKICLNPAPFDDSIKLLPLNKLDVLIINETEGKGLSGREEPDEIITELSHRFPTTTIILTLGKNGALCVSRGNLISCPVLETNVVDTTAAGDTFIGYFLAGKIRGYKIEKCIRLACAAASLTVTKSGAAESIPGWNEAEAAFLSMSL